MRQVVSANTFSVFPLGLQIAQSRYYLQTLDPKVGTTCILGALGFRCFVSVILRLSLWLCFLSSSPSFALAVITPLHHG